MNDETDLQVDWGSLGEEWWRETAAQVRATEQQMQFAACVFSGMTYTRAAMCAGYTTDKVRARFAGSDAHKSVGVQTLLTLARADARNAGEGKAPVTLVTRAELKQKLSDIVRGSDPSLALRAGESLSKMLEPEASDFASLDDGFASWRLVRDYLLLPNGGPAVALLYTGSGESIGSIPLLHDVAAAVKRDAPDLWERLVSPLSAVSRVMLDRQLADSDWQRDAREKLWREVGLEIFTDRETTQAVVRDVNGRPMARLETADARG